jgi:hypothetical protein
MEMTPVSSTNLAAVGYDESTHTLRVEFRHGGVYDYFDVPEPEYESLMRASSHGQYLAYNIKGRYRYAKV